MGLWLMLCPLWRHNYQIVSKLLWIILEKLNHPGINRPNDYQRFWEGKCVQVFITAEVGLKWVISEFRCSSRLLDHAWLNCTSGGEEGGSAVREVPGRGLIEPGKPLYLHRIYQSTYLLSFCTPDNTIEPAGLPPVCAMMPTSDILLAFRDITETLM